jgi:hypothetical protein
VRRDEDIVALPARPGGSLASHCWAALK